MRQTDTSPTVRRRRLGLKLREYRDAAGKSVEEAAAHMDTTVRTLLRWEAGQANIRARDLFALLNFYGVERQDLRDELEVLAREARKKGWWTPYTSAVRPTFATFLGLEAGAQSLMEYTAIVVPGLLQTEAYMRAIMRAAVPALDDATIERRVELRTKRQAEMLGRGTPVHVVIDQSCLLRRVGSEQVMAEQLDHLVTLSETVRQVTVQVLPFEVGTHASVLGSFSVLTFADMPPVACVELLGGDLYADGDDSRLYTAHFDKLRESALPQPLAVDLVQRLRGEIPC